MVGATENYANFSQGAKLLFVWLMMLGRVEVFSVLVLIFPTFWRRVYDGRFLAFPKRSGVPKAAKLVEQF